MMALAALLFLTPQDVGTLLNRLASDEVAVREEAHAELVKRGLPVLDALAGRPAPSDAEAAARLDSVVRAIIGRTARAGWGSPVTLDVKDASFASVLELLRKESRLKIELDDRNVPDDLRIEALKLDGAPFPEALDKMLAAGNLEILRAGPDGIRIGCRARIVFRFTKVKTDVIFKMASTTDGVTVTPEPGVSETIDYANETRSWSSMVDDIAARSGWVALWTGPKKVRVLKRADFEEELKTEPFVLAHVRPAEPARFGALLAAAESKLTRGASWTTVLGKLTYDPRHAALIVTDRPEILAEISRLVKEIDRKSE